MEFERVEPFGPKRDDLRIASVVAALMNINQARKRGQAPKPYTPQDVTMLFGDDAEAASKPKRKSWQEMKADIMGFIGTLPTEPPKD